MKLRPLLKELPGLVRVTGYEGINITGLSMDSRSVSPGSMFFCIPGTRVDGHIYAPQAVAAGAVALVVERELEIDCVQVIVRDVRATLARIAAEFYGHPAKQMKLLGVTGTKGKTTTCYMVRSILMRAGHKVGLLGSVGAMIGLRELPMTLTTPDPIDFHRLLREMADEGVTHVVMEVSAHAMALRKMAGMVFEVALFTNLSQDHFDFFGDMESYYKSKRRLFEPDMCRFALFNGDDEHTARAAAETGVPHELYAIRESAQIHANDIEIGERGVIYRLCFNKRFDIQIKLNLPGMFNVYNSMAAAAMCDALGIPPEAIRDGLSDLKSVPGRVEVLETETLYRVILDFAHSPDSLENILRTIRQTAQRKVIVVFGCGGDRDRDKRPIMGEVAGRLADLCILTSDNPRGEDPLTILKAIEEGVRPTGAPYQVIENRKEAIRYALSHAEPGDVVVLAGKGNEKYQEIKGVKHPFDERIVVAQLLEEMRGA